jgi:hypothetical protein
MYDVDKSCNPFAVTGRHTASVSTYLGFLLNQTNNQHHVQPTLTLMSQGGYFDPK